MPVAVSGLLSVEGADTFQEGYVPAIGAVVSRRAYGFGVEKGAGGHMFHLNFNNGQGTTFGQLAHGGSADSLYLGFNLARNIFYQSGEIS